jgi:putative oxidoreductase
MEDTQMALNFLNKYRDVGLLIIRIGLGVMFIWHGWPKISGGPEMWGKIGMAMGTVGIHFAPVFWGFMAAFAEFGGGILIALGLFFRWANAMLVVDMFVAATLHMHTAGQGLPMASHPIEDGIVFLGLILVGPGRYSLDHVIWPAGEQKSIIAVPTVSASEKSPVASGPQGGAPT